MAIYYGNSPQNVNYRGRVEITETPHVESNTSTIAWSFKLYRADGYSSPYNRSTGNVITFSADGVTRTPSYTASTVSMSGATSESSAITLASGTFDIEHDYGTGQKQFSFSAVYYNTSSSSIGSSSAPLVVSGVFSCVTIARASVITSDVSEIALAEGQAQHIRLSMPRANTSFSHNLFYSFHGGDWSVIAQNVGDAYDWTIPSFSTLVAQCTNAPYADCVIACNTMNGDTLVGTTSCTVRFTIPAYTPTFTVTVTPVGTGSGIGYIQNLNVARVQYNFSGVWGSSLNRCFINGYEVGSNTFQFDSLPMSGDYTFNVGIEDSRGYTNNFNQTITILPYTQPTMGNVKVWRCTSDGTASSGGTYIYTEVTPSISSLGGNNQYGQLAVVFGQPSSGYGEPSYISYDTTTGTYHKIWGDGSFATTQQWLVYLQLFDSFSNSSASYTIPEQSVSIYERARNKGVGLGTYVEHDNQFVVSPAWSMYHGSHSIDAISDVVLDPDNGYIYYESGLLVQWKKVSVQGVNVTNPYGSMFAAYIDGGSFLKAFSGTPVVTPTWESGAYTAWISQALAVTNSQWGSFMILTGGAYAVYGTMHLLAIGVRHD